MAASDGGRVLLGIGVDIVEVERVAGVARRHGERFLRRVFTPREVELAHGNREQYLASRFAAKEAAFKALGTGWSGGVRWTDVEVENLPSGQPILRLSGAARARAEALGAERFLLTISHTAEHALAHVMLEGRGQADGGATATEV